MAKVEVGERAIVDADEFACVASTAAGLVVVAESGLGACVGSAAVACAAAPAEEVGVAWAVSPNDEPAVECGGAAGRNDPVVGVDDPVEVDFHPWLSAKADLVLDKVELGRVACEGHPPS